MPTNLMFRELREAQSRLEALYQQGQETNLPKATRDAYDGLFMALEVLQIAEDEIRYQHESLVAAEEIARIERQRYEELFNLAPDAYFITNSFGIIQQANQATAQLLDINPTFLVGKPLSVYVAEVERRTFRAQLQRLTRTAPGQIQEWELTIQSRRDRAPIAVAASVVPIIDPDGITAGFRWLFRDITRRKETEIQLRETNQTLTTLIEASPLAIVMHDHEGCVQLWNRAAEQILGWAESEVIGQILPFIPAERKPEIEQKLAVMLRNETPFVYETVNKRKDGSLVPVLLSIAPLRRADSNSHGVIMLLMDRTEQQQAQAELVTAKAQLATARETERSYLARELHDGVVQQLLALQLRLHAQRRVASQNDSPFPEQEESQTLLENFEHEVGGMVQLLRGVMSALRPAGLEEYGLTAALDGYLGQLRREWSHSETIVQTRLDPSSKALPLPIATCLFRVAQEAVRNALRHAQAKTIEVRLTYSASHAMLSVYDDGKGFTIPPRLTQLALGGHFGLVGIMERVELLDGLLAIDSDPREGTTVTVELPLPSA